MQISTQGASVVWSIFFKLRQVSVPRTLSLVSRESHQFSHLYGRSARVNTHPLKEGLTFFDLEQHNTSQAKAEFLGLPSAVSRIPMLKTPVLIKNSPLLMYEAGFFFPNVHTTVNPSNVKTWFARPGQIQVSSDQSRLKLRAFKPNAARAITRQTE